MFELLSLSSCIIIIIIIISGYYLYRNIISPLRRILSDPNTTVVDATNNITEEIVSNVPNAVQSTKQILSEIVQSARNKINSL